jgi:hypothetical protein
MFVGNCYSEFPMCVSEDMTETFNGEVKDYTVYINTEESYTISINQEENYEVYIDQEASFILEK